MFEAAEIGHKLTKSEYKREEPKLRQALLAAQYGLLENGRFPVIILVNGVDGAGTVAALAQPAARGATQCRQVVFHFFLQLQDLPQACLALVVV